MSRRERVCLIAAIVITALVVVFAVLNVDDVKVHWIVTTAQTPLIVVIVVSLLLGVVLDRLLVIRARRRRNR